MKCPVTRQSEIEKAVLAAAHAAVSRSVNAACARVVEKHNAFMEVIGGAIAESLVETLAREPKP